MKIHEYQAKDLFRAAGVAVPEGKVARTPEEAVAVFQALGRPVAVVKSQIHAGGRGKGTFIENSQQRGVQLVRTAEEAKTAAQGMLGNKLVTIQTGSAGQVVRQVFVEAGCEIDRELYLAILIDREKSKRPLLMASSAGGMNIEDVAAETPELIHKETYDAAVGLESFQIRKLCKKLGIAGPAARAADGFMKALARLFVKQDCSLVEVNPLVITKSGELMALDGKITFDDNADFRHKEMFDSLRDVAEEDPAELRAKQTGLSFVKLDGNIGCLVNGAGLAMSTMDLIKLHGGEPANFLDVGGGAKADQVAEAFRIILSDPNVKAVLVNIFGGIMQCTTIASAIIEAYKTVKFEVPLVVRLEGTEVEAGRKMLAQSGVPILNANGLTEAAQMVVKAAG